VGQLFGVAMHQHRTLYVAIPLGFLALILMGEVAYSLKAISTVVASVLVVALLTSAVGLELKGRVGPVNLNFLEEHVESLSMKRGTPAVGTLYDREKWYSGVWERSQSSLQTLLLGVGFGQPLIHFRVVGGVDVRQPHNTFLSVLGRLGLLGLIFWLIFHISVLTHFAQGIRNRRQADGLVCDLIPWLFLFYMFSVMVTSVQPYLEFSYGAIPFYFIVGFAIGVIYWHVPAPERRGVAIRISPAPGLSRTAYNLPA